MKVGVSAVSVHGSPRNPVAEQLLEPRGSRMVCEEYHRCRGVARVDDESRS